MSVPSYNLASGHEASYSVSEDGNTTVGVRNANPLNFREVYVGAASLEFGWVSTGKSRSWTANATIIDPTPAHHTEMLADDGITQIINVELGKKMFPASGLVDPNFEGEIVAPAIHFDVPHAYDLWVILLRSPWFPMKIEVEKSSLNISHNFAQATAQIEVVDDVGGGQMLRADVLLHGEGFKRVWLSLKRIARGTITRGTSTEETLGEVTSTGTFTWKPSMRDFNLLLVTPSKIDINDFVGFVKSLGADAKSSGFFAPTLNSGFLLCDGFNMTYTLT